jgi:hypothetical protein
MIRFPRPGPVDRAAYHPDANDLPAFYGLPARVRFCKSCVISNQRPSSGS